MVLLMINLNKKKVLIPQNKHSGRLIYELIVIPKVLLY